MKHVFAVILLSFFTLAFTACPGPGGEFPQTTIYQAEVGEWSIYQCTDLYGTGGPGQEKSVTLGLNNYRTPCLLQSPSIYVSHLSPGTRLKVTVLQEGGPSTLTDIPFYSHLFIRFGTSDISGEQIQYLPFSPGEEYEASYTFEIPPGVLTFNPVLGVDPTYITGPGTPADQPTVTLKTVKLEILQ